MLSRLIGGLNFQIEHPLFPRNSHVHYPLAARVATITRREYGMNYRKHRAFRAGSDACAAPLTAGQ